MATDPAGQSSAYAYNYDGYDDDGSTDGDDGIDVPPNCKEYPVYNRKTKIYFSCGEGLGNPIFNS